MLSSILKILATASAGVVAGAGATASVPVVTTDTAALVTGVVSSVLAWYMSRTKG